MWKAKQPPPKKRKRFYAEETPLAEKPDGHFGPWFGGRGVSAKHLGHVKGQPKKKKEAGPLFPLKLGLFVFLALFPQF